jgi:hypothetical protein
VTGELGGRERCSSSRLKEWSALDNKKGQPAKEWLGSSGGIEPLI